MIPLLLSLLGCRGDEVAHIPGTTFRTRAPVVEGGTGNDMSVYLFQRPEDCLGTGVKEEDLPYCLPYVDRAAGIVRFGFQVRIDGRKWPMPLTVDNVSVRHSRRPPPSFELIPHDPVETDQLFVLLLDNTYSMGNVDPGESKSRLEKVKGALMQKDVLKAFFPGGQVKTGVLPLMLRGGAEPIPLSKKLITETPAELIEAVNANLTGPSGYTPLYRAVSHILGKTLSQPEVADYIKRRELQPTIIILTDGFNDDAAPDTCGDNVPKLNVLLEQLRTIRSASDPRFRPTLWTVGLGSKSIGGTFRRPDNLSVSATDLCGPYARRVIDGDLELYGVDNRGLSLMAFDGGGDSFVSRKQEGLAAAFKEAASRRYNWFEVRYPIDPFYLRREFLAQVKLSTTGSPTSTLAIVPNPWIDAPPASPSKDGKIAAPSFARTLGVLLPVLGALISLSYFPAALFNARRAIFGLVPQRGRRKK